MAVSCGIHLDRSRYTVVCLDGSAKKHKVSAWATGELSTGDDVVSQGAAALREALKGQKVSSDSIGLVVDSGLAAFRSMNLPFDERSKIEEVIKYEIESDLPQWDIDDVVVDFVVVDSKPGVESSLLVTAVPKERLEVPLAICEKAGCEPLDIEVDGTALYEAGRAAGLFADEAASILVHVGDVSTTVVVVDEDRLTSVRAIRAGALAPETASEPAGESDGDEAGPSAPAEDVASKRARQEATVQRLRRELTRTVSASGTQNEVQGIWVCGHDLPGFEGEELLDVPVQRLEALPHDAGIPESGELAIAYGAALRRMGAGALSPHLRREELRYSGKFERLEMPLAVMSLILVTLLGIMLIVIEKRIAWRDEGNLAKGERGDMQIWLEASNEFMLPNADRGYPGRIENPPETISAYAKMAEAGGDEDRTKFEEILQIRTRLNLEITKLKKELGQISEITQPQSALEGMTRVLDVMNGLGEQVGRFGIRQINADYQAGRSGRQDAVVVKLDLDFFADDDLTATKNYTALQNALEAEDWVTEFEGKSTKVLESGGGIYVDGVTVRLDLSMIEEGE